ncbi:unnamed protein product [Heterosigma akashiwo]
MGDAVKERMPLVSGERAVKAKSKFTWAQVRELIAEGRDLLVYEDGVYDLTKWKVHHPGGDLAITHLVGMDATNQIRGNHSEEIIRKKMPTFFVGRLVDNKLSQVEREFRELDKKLAAKGLYQTQYSFYYKQALKLLVLFSAAIATVVIGSGTWWGTLLGAFLLASYWQQSAFVAHDAGHCGITKDVQNDYAIGLFLGNVLGGISIGWWKDSHYVHHIVTNDVEHDPDIQHMPVFAVTEKFFKGVHSTYHDLTFQYDAVARAAIRVQHLVYYPLLMLGRFLLYLNSFKFLLLCRRARRRRAAELAGLALFWAWFGSLVAFAVPTWPQRVAFVLLSHALTFILHVQITLSHFSMDTEPRGQDEEFVRHQLRTSLDVDCPPWMDWFHGGLQFQAIHHLFPRVPRHNLRTVQAEVAGFCRRHGLRYHLQTFGKANASTLSTLRAVADQAKFLAKVATSDHILGHHHH